MQLHNQLRVVVTQRLSTAMAGAVLIILGTANCTKAASLRAIQSFTGTTYNDSGWFPPDTVGAVGPSQIVEFTNGRYSVYDKSTNQLLSSSSLNNFWQKGGPISSTAENGTTDPRVLYDPSSQRWFAAVIDFGKTNDGVNFFDNKALVAVSKTSNASEGWTVYPLQLGGADDKSFHDFPTFGINSDFLYVSTNNFNPSGVSLAYVNKDALLSNDPFQGLLSATIPVVPDNTGYTAQPVVNLDNSNSTQFLLSNYNTPNGSLKKTTIEFDSASGINFIPNPSDSFINVPKYNNPPSAKQPDIKPTASNPSPEQFDLEVGDTRFSSSVILKNGNIWGVQSVKNNGRSALRWVKIDASTNAVKSGLISDPNLDFYYGSIAVNDAGEVVIGFNGSSKSQFASSYAVLGDASSGTFGQPLLLQPGRSNYQIIQEVKDKDGNVIDKRNRWGDYSATVVDPSNPSIFWTFQEWAANSNQWATRITALTADANIPVGSIEPSGAVQVTALEPTLDNSGVSQFIDAPSGFWFAAPTSDALGVEYSITSPASLFTQILDFPSLLSGSPISAEPDFEAGIDALEEISTKRFNVFVGGKTLGSFGSGDSLDFVNLLGSGVSNFIITESNPTEGEFFPSDFALKLAFNTPKASFEVKPIKSVPEPSSLLGLMELGAFFSYALVKSFLKKVKGL